MYRGYGITFDSAGYWSFDNDSARNVIIFGADKGSSSHPDNRNNNFLILGQDPTFGINGSFGSPEKKFDINFSKANTSFCLSLLYNHYNSWVFLLMEKKSLNLKLTIEMLNVSFVLEVFLMDLLLLGLDKYL